MFLRQCIILFFLIITSLSLLAQEDTMTGIFCPSFHSLQIKVEGNEYAPPVIMLNSNDRIIINFDEIAEDQRYMRYSLVHCDAQWQPTGLVDAEYIDGFNLGDVEQYEFSQMTTTHYVNYTIALPNDQVRFTISGNYLLKVFPEDNPDKILLQARFSVSENTMKVSGGVTSRTDIDYNNRHQQLSVVVDADKVRVQDMFNDLKLVITQNGRIDNQVVVNKPLRIASRIAYFEHLQPLIFLAGNEYRRMEIISTQYPGMGVEEINYANPLYHMHLTIDKPRYAGSYSYDQTQFGRYKIREYNSSMSDIEADYVIAHFSLDMPELINTDIFLDGDFTYRRFSPQSRMIYNNVTKCYEKSILLKQGAYNYQYLAVPSGSSHGKTSIVEGNFYQTINEYIAMVYHRPPGSRYDRLVGATIIYSGR